MPPEWAYGVEGYPPIIPTNATIVYDIELISYSSIGTANLAELYSRGTDLRKTVMAMTD